MKRASLVLSTLALLIFLIGCGTSGKDFSSNKVRDIQNNTTTRAEIIDWFGEPFKKGEKNGNAVWTYQYDTYNALGKPSSKDLVILFGDNNVVRGYKYTTSENE